MYKNMIKTFEQFINENYSETPVLAFGEEYGSPLFNEVSESLVYEIHKSINEGRLVIDANMIEEGLFDAIGKLFKKGSDAMAQKIEDNNAELKSTKGAMEFMLNNLHLDGAGDDIQTWGRDINDLLKDEKLYKKIEELCKMAEDICAKLAEKENEMYKTISEKMTAANEAIKEFTEKAIAKIKEIVEVAKDKISSAVAAVIMFCKRMAAFATKAMEKIGKGIVLAFALPFVLAFAVYKGALKVCEALVEKVKDGAKIIKDSFVKIKDSIVAWVKDALTKAKDVLKKACDAIKDGAKAAYKAIGKAFLAIVAVLGQLASDAKDAIKEAYDSFVAGVKEFADEVKAFVKEKWDIVANWCKKTATAFADGVKNVWDKMKEKVTAAVGAVKDAYNTLKDNAKATWEDIKKWSDDKQKAYYKDSLKYASEKWGKDEVSSWMDEL
jgi:gas vesicle protein